MSVQCTITLSVGTFRQVADYLQSHSWDIAEGVDDFGELSDFYQEFFGIAPEGYDDE